MALTATQLADFQSDLGIGSDEAVFTDAELERLYTRAADDYATAVYFAWRQLLAAATKYVDYRVAQTQESRSQAYSHIKDMVAYWRGESEDSTNVRGVAIAGVNPIPTAWKDAPYESEGQGRRLRRRRRDYY